ncbi:MAG: hypothetical protein ABSH06_21255 [Thermodesulfobacteriota bacterium]|jgi:hypothetical protein
MTLESKYHRRIRGRIDDLIDELGDGDELERSLTYDEIKIEFAKRGFPRPFHKVVDGILQDRERRQTI